VTEGGKFKITKKRRSLTKGTKRQDRIAEEKRVVIKDLARKSKITNRN